MSIATTEVERLISERHALNKCGACDDAERIKHHLLASGVTLADLTTGTRWTRTWCPECGAMVGR